MHHHISSRIVRAVEDTRGTVAIVFALSSVVILMAGALALDYGRTVSLRTNLQNAADSAALAGASMMGATPDQRIAFATTVFHKNAAGTNLNLAPTVAMESGGEVVSVTIDAALPTFLAGVAGFETVEISVKSAAALPTFKGEIAMVLDYSSSMTSSAGNGQEKWQAMRDAATDLIDRLLNGKSNPDLKIGLVPFAENVYVTLAGEYVIGGTAGTSWTNCTKDRRYPYVSSDSTPIASNNDTKWGRTDSNDVIDANEYDDCANYPPRNLVVLPLTNNHTVVKDQLAAMVPHAGTNISAGMSFGWHLISPNAPFAEGAAYGAVDKTIILLSDGEQTASSFGPGNSYNVNSGELNLVDMCNYIKAQGARLITVAFGTSIGGSTLSRLQNCASASHFFYNPPDGETLAMVFKDIGHRIGGDARLVN